MLENYGLLTKLRFTQLELLYKSIHKPKNPSANGTKGGITRGIMGTNTFTSPLRAIKAYTDMLTYSFLSDNKLKYHDNETIFLACNDFYDNAFTSVAEKVNRMKLGLTGEQKDNPAPKDVKKKKAEITGNTLSKGQKLYAGDFITSPNKSYKLIFQEDGNLVQYNSEGKAVWASGTHNQGGQYAVMQTDGNLVIYRGNGEAVWSVHNAKGFEFVENASLSLQDDSNLVIYSPNGRPIWASL